MTEAKKKDALAIIESVSGIKREESLRIFEQVKANRRALDACDGPHDFAGVDEGRPGRDYRCKKCNGKVDVHAHYWYEQGLKHGII